MLTKRDFAMMMTMIIVVLALFLSSVGLKEYFNDYDVNHMAEAEAIPKNVQISDSDGAQRQIMYFGTEDNGYCRAIKEWAEYRKRVFNVFPSLNEADGIFNSAEQKACLLVDGELLEQDTENATETLLQYANSGGIVIFYRLPSYNTIKESAALQNLLGIQRLRSEKVKLREIRLYGGFLLGGETHYSFEGVKEPELADMESEIPWYDVSSRTKTYMVGFLSDEEKNSLGINNEDMPAIIWRSNTGKGSVFAVNGDYMKDAALGLLDAMLYESESYSLYTVVNAQNLSVTGFPDLTVENEEQIEEIYGMTSEQFCRDILWPSLVAAAHKGEWRITCFVSLKQSDNSLNEPKKDSLVDYLKYFNEESAEAGVSLGRIDSADIRLSAADEKELLKSWGLNYLFAGGYVRRENKDKLSSLTDGSGQMEYFRDIRTVVGEYEEDLQVFSWLTDKITLQNATSSAYKHSYKDSFRLKGLQTALAYSNVQADIYRILWPETEKDEWEKLAEKLASNIDTYWKPFSSFDKTTISESDARVRNFLNGRLESTKNADRISIRTEGYSGKAYAILRTHGEKLTKMSGGSFEQIEKDAYLLKLTSDTAELTLKAETELYYK